MAIDPRAADTLALLEAGQYVARSGAVVQLAGAIAAAKAGTALYAPEDITALALPTAAGAPRARIEITSETTSAAARRLYEREGVRDAAAHNFASAKRIGGGFLTGSNAQEEDLCRCSALFKCLESQPRYYQANRAQGGCLYTDHAIWSPRVPFFRDDTLALTEEPYFVSVVTMPAPSARDLEKYPLVRRGDLDAVLQTRALKVLQVAADRQHRTLILGAWGCGAFRNPATVVARAFADALEQMPGAFDRVVFAIYERTKDGPNRVAFERRFA